MRSVVGGLAVVVLVLAGCGSGESPASTASASASAPPSAPQRPLGPDPGPAAYRALDVCALVPLATLQRAYTAAGGSGTLRGLSGGPALCSYTTQDRAASATLRLDAPRDQLPPDVITTDAGVNTVDTDPAGVIVHDPAVSSAHVLSTSGYLLLVAGSG